ncbi:hypothetical protein MF271_00650 (plasmid) [Deinococcus sp. KNUC1210]|nr:hypothetical protein [Deinococcus sp. KNUC1210]ULH14022.1 hypothetical protein MF271_00650 [Deinococcus sp. KNUC1210]
MTSWLRLHLAARPNVPLLLISEVKRSTRSVRYELEPEFLLEAYAAQVGP